MASHPSDLVRDQYVMKLAGSLDIDADRLRDTVARLRSESARGARPPDAGGPRRGAPPATARNDRDAPSETVSRSVDRRELDVLLYAVHQPELVADWLDAKLFADPVARAVFEQFADAGDFHEALDSSEGIVRDLLERLAVEEPISNDEPETLRAHLMANTIGPAAQRVLASMLRSNDERATSVKLLLDALAHARETGDWQAVEYLATELLGWTGEVSRGTKPA